MFSCDSFLRALLTRVRLNYGRGLACSHSNKVALHIYPRTVRGTLFPRLPFLDRSMGSSGDEADKRKSTAPPISSRPSLVKSILEQTALGQECVEKEDLKGALQHFQSALEKTESLSDKEQPKLKLSCLLNAGACLVSSGEPESGLKLLETAWELTESQGTRERDDDGDEGKEQQKEEEEKEAKENSKTRADLLYHIGTAAQAMGDVEKAEANFKRSVDEHIKIGDKNQAADVFCALADCHQRASQHEKQIACLLSAQKLFGEAGEEGKEALSCAELSMAYLATGRDEECRQMLTTAKMMSLRLDDVKMQGELTTTTTTTTITIATTTTTTLLT